MLMFSRCRHRWEVRQVNHDRVSWTEKTVVLLVCTVCGKPKTYRINGLWRLEDLVVASDKDIEKLLEAR